MTVRLIHGDCLEILPTLDENSIDTIITDPPYGLEFMGKDWDYGVPGKQFWIESLRVAKPGAMMLAFGGTRTHHRLMCAIEDAGWVIRDVIMWVYGSGFPKSHNISKAIDKAAGAERDVVGRQKLWGHNAQPGRGGQYANSYSGQSHTNSISTPITAPATPEAQLWDGWGTALKPAYEPIIVAMKPKDGTFANNALKWGVAGLNINGGRVGTEEIAAHGGGLIGNRTYGMGKGIPPMEAGVNPHKGRWPANIIHDGSDEVTALFPQTKSGKMKRGVAKHSHWTENEFDNNETYGDSGSAARFFYCAKASRAERNAGLDGMEERSKYTNDPNSHGTQEMWGSDKRDGKSSIKPASNFHPTVKPIALMRYLCKLTATPTGGVVLDPFMGSGSTGCAAVLEGRDFIGIDLEADYVEIARRRIAHWEIERANDMPLFGGE